MTRWTPDPTFYPSPRDAAAAPAEQLAYVAAFDRSAERPDAIAVIDTDPGSAAYGRVVGWTDLPHTGDELHHFGWNACSSALCPTAPHPHVERRYLIVPGLRSSRIYVLDTKDDPRSPTDRQGDRGRRSWPSKAGYSPAAHRALRARTASTSRRSAAATARRARAASRVLDHTTFEVRGRVGDRPRRPVPGVRLLVAPRPTTCWSPASGARRR